MWGQPMNVIMTTKVDPASMNIKRKLIENFGFKEGERILMEIPSIKTEKQ